MCELLHLALEQLLLLLYIIPLITHLGSVDNKISIVLSAAGQIWYRHTS